MIVKFSDVVSRVNVFVDKENTDLKYYIGKGANESIDSDDFEAYPRNVLEGSTIGYKFHFRFEIGDILFMSRSFEQHKCATATFPGICSDSTYVVRSKDERVLLQSYLQLVMQSQNFWEWLWNNKTGGVNYLINYGTLANYEFELPSIEVQKSIADRAWAAYRLKEAYKRLLAATDEMVKSQFIELIRDCKTYLSISDLSLNFLKGITPTYVESSCVKVINQACVTWKGIDFSKVKYQNSESSFAKGILNSDDLLLTMTGRGTLGRCNIFSPENDDITYIADSHISILRVNNILVLPIIIARYISLSDTQDEIYRNYVTGSTNQLDIVFSKIKNFKIPVPPMALQKEFAEIVRQADKSKFELKKAIEAIDQVIKSLING